MKGGQMDGGQKMQKWETEERQIKENNGSERKT